MQDPSPPPKEEETAASHAAESSPLAPGPSNDLPAFNPDELWHLKVSRQSGFVTIKFRSLCKCGKGWGTINQVALWKGREHCLLFLLVVSVFRT